MEIKIDTNQPSTSKVFDRGHVIVEDYQTDSDNEEDVSKEKISPVVSKETTIPRIVEDQVYEETKKFDKIMKEKGSHYLDSNMVVYLIFKCIDDVLTIRMNTFLCL